MAIKVYLFGQLKELTGLSEILLDGISDTDQLVNEMAGRFPVIKGLPCLVAVGREIIHSNTSLKEGQELALLPPYSGG
jgi:molybdopterin converting factor small subunit